jgi:2-dehydro-3-deoxyphosphogluconate aldolase / (4S)-4-hydroxy-2-oxoglutarate aldolase
VATEWFMAQVQALRVLPLVTLDLPTSGVAVARALATAGLAGMEVSLRSEGALDAIAAVAEAMPEVLLGAGTVMHAEQVDDAVAAGARFVGSPVTERAVIDRAARLNVPIIPGIADLADAVAAAREGVRVVRLIVAPGSDGIGTVGRFARSFPRMQCIPAGALRPADLPAYLRQPGVLAVATTLLAPYGTPSFEVSRRAAQAAVVACT